MVAYRDGARQLHVSVRLSLFSPLFLSSGATAKIYSWSVFLLNSAKTVFRLLFESFLNSSTNESKSSEKRLQLPHIPGTRRGRQGKTGQEEDGAFINPGHLHIYPGNPGNL